MRQIAPASWGFVPVTDKDEDEHRVDLINATLYCTCRGFIHWRHCKHVDEMEKEMATDLSDLRNNVALERAEFQVAEFHRNPMDLAQRLSNMKQERGLVAEFFKEVMERDLDYGIIPGTGDKPTLYKAGAEKLLELYGYAPTIRDRQETIDHQSGYYRVVVTIALIQRGTNIVVAEGVGECNTREARYFYRWVTDSKLPPGIDKALLRREERRGRNNSTFYVYRVENDDLHTLWNTVLKMAKKRALVDATLSSTRSSGLFSQSQAALDDWIEAEYTVTDLDSDDDEDEAPKPRPASNPRATATTSPARPATVTPARSTSIDDVMKTWWENIEQLGIPRDTALSESNLMFGNRDPKDLKPQERATLLVELRKMRTAQVKGPEAKAAVAEHVHTPAYTKTGTYVCSDCGEILEEPAAAEEEETE